MSAWLRYIIVGIIVIALGALAGWYFFLRSAQNATTQAGEARGIGQSIPAYTGSTGSTYQNVQTTLSEGSGSAVSSSTASIGRLWEVSNVPVAGFGWSTSTLPSLYFAERSSGFVFLANVHGHAVKRLTDTLRPKTYEASFAPDGSLIERSVDEAAGTITTFAGTIAPASSQVATSSPDTLKGVALPQNISAIAPNAASHTLFFLLNSSSGASLLSTDWSGNRQKRIATLPLEDWRLYALSDGSVELAQKAADDVAGYAYRLQKSGTLTLLAEGPGLTILPNPSSSVLIYSLSGGGALSLFGEASASLTPLALNLATVAQKCAWVPNAKSARAYCAVPQVVPTAQLLDDWYKGVVHTADTIWQVDVGAASSTMVYSPAAETAQPLDIQNLSIDPSGQYLAFTNGADQSLWILALANTI